MSDPASTISKKDSNDPGASRHGNFMNYYQFHSAEERVNQLPKEALLRSILEEHRPATQKYVVLDVGCNAGDLTLQLYKFLRENLPADREISILGIDLDPILIELAKEKNDKPEAVTFECLDFFSDSRESVIKSYLNEHGIKQPCFDVIFCFSITMWVHLNRGDHGLKKFLEDICSISKIVLIEPQLWSSYRNASRRMRRANLGEFPLLPGLQMRGDVKAHIERILQENCGYVKITETAENEWSRRLLLYKKDHGKVTLKKKEMES